MGLIRPIPILFNKKEECFGCCACYAICNRSAILMLKDEEGFEYPYVDENICVRCYLCLKVCPIRNVKIWEEFYNKNDV